MNARLMDVHTALPASVVTYDAVAQTVDVQPLVQRVVQDSDTGATLIESLPQIPKVPVAFPRAGNNWITFPIAAGDTVLLLFCERGIDTWRAADSESDPGHLRMHDLSDAVAIPGVYATPKAVTTSTTAAVFSVDQELHLGGLNPAEFVALATATHDAINALRTTVNALVTDINNLKTVFGVTWIPVPMDGGAALKTASGAWAAAPATAPGTVPQVAATKVKAL